VEVVQVRDNIEVFEITETGADYIRLRSSVMAVRINFADDSMSTKEESAAFFVD
jgi:hypothetical protein